MSHFYYAWHNTKNYKPCPYVSVLIWVPSLYPTPSVHEAYLVDDDPSEVDFFVCPSLVGKPVFLLDEVPFWTEMAEPPFTESKLIERPTRKTEENI